MGKSEGSGEEDQTEEPEPAGTVFMLPEEILSTALPPGCDVSRTSQDKQKLHDRSGTSETGLSVATVVLLRH